MQRIDDIRIKRLNPAALKGDLDLVKKIIEEYASFDLRPNGLTVSKAIQSGNIALLDYFKEAFSITPSHLSPNEINNAIRHIKSPDVFKYLFNDRTLKFSCDTQTTEIVARSGNLENLKLLLSARLPQANSDTLFAAVSAGHMHCVKFLVEEYKIDGELVITDYDESIGKAEMMKFDEIAIYLKEKKAISNQNQSTSNKVITNEIQMQTLVSQPTIKKPVDDTSDLYKQLFDASKNLRSDEVKQLLNKKLNPNIQDEEGNSPIFYAIVNIDFESVENLHNVGADLNLINKYDETPLMYVYRKCMADHVYQLLLAKGANPYIKTRNGTLFEIAEKAHRDIELQAIREWEIDNLDRANKLWREAQITAKPQASVICNVTKPFIASPIHTKSSQTSTTKLENIYLTSGHLQVVFNQTADADWLLQIKNEKEEKQKYSLLFSGKYSKEAISKIQKYLRENDISGLSDFLEERGVTANEMTQYLRQELKNSEFKPKR